MDSDLQRMNAKVVGGTDIGISSNLQSFKRVTVIVRMAVRISL